MKVPFVATVLAIAATVSGAPSAQKTFAQVPLQGQRWDAGPTLFPGEVLKGYNANLNTTNSTAWSEHVLGKCKQNKYCTSSLTFSAINSGEPKDRAWFGYIFSGGPTTQANYTKCHGCRDAVAYTIVESS